VDERGEDRRQARGKLVALIWWNYHPEGASQWTELEKGRNHPQFEEAFGAKMATKPDAPEVSEEVEDAWAAFQLALNCRVISMNGREGFDWSQLEPVLSLYGLWRRDIHTALQFCEPILRVCEAETKKRRPGGSSKHPASAPRGQARRR
jgi:hypothetical protein